MRRCRPCTDICLLPKDSYHRCSTNQLWCAAPEQQQPEVSVSSSIDLNKEVRMKCYVGIPFLDASADANMIHPMHMHTRMHADKATSGLSLCRSASLQKTLRPPSHPGPRANRIRHTKVGHSSQCKQFCEQHHEITDTESQKQILTQWSCCAGSTLYSVFVWQAYISVVVSPAATACAVAVVPVMCGCRHITRVIAADV